MRSVVYSITFNDQLNELLDMGEAKFGTRVVDAKKDLVYSTIRNILANNPAIKQPDPSLGLVVYPIHRTPFFILYDFDDTTLRVHFIFLKGKPLEAIDPAAVDWQST